MTKARCSECMRIPDDVPVGAVIGKGGRHSKLIALTHGVRFNVDSHTRTVTLSGSRNGVDGAVNDLTAQLERYRLNQHVSRGQEKKNAIHALAVARHGMHSLWRFRQVDADTSVDPSVRDATFRLEEMEDQTTERDNAAQERDEEDDAAEQDDTWMFEFNDAFQQRLVRQVCQITDSSTQEIKIRVVCGQTCFSVPRGSLAHGPGVSWEELNRLNVYDRPSHRWSNAGNRQSRIFSKLLRDLEALYTPATVFEHELMVYIDPCHRGDRAPASKHEGLSVVFRREGDQWVALDRRPVSVVHALYNIALDNHTAFRVRVYSRKAATQTTSHANDLASRMEISEPVAGDPFTTNVVPGSDFPAELRIRSFAVKTKTRVNWQGLSFVVSYMDAQRENVSVFCKLTQPEHDGDPHTTRSSCVQQLIDRVLLAVTAK